MSNKANKTTEPATEQTTAAEQAAKALKKESEEKTISIQIRGMRNGDTMKYACGGLHLSREHRDLLPKVIKKDSLGRDREQVKRKMVPGEVYALPASVAKFYLKASPDFLEAVVE